MHAIEQHNENSSRHRQVGGNDPFQFPVNDPILSLVIKLGCAVQAYVVCRDIFFKEPMYPGLTPLTSWSIKIVPPIGIAQSLGWIDRELSRQNIPRYFPGLALDRFLPIYIIGLLGADLAADSLLETYPMLFTVVISSFTTKAPHQRLRKEFTEIISGARDSLTPETVDAAIYTLGIFCLCCIEPFFSRQETNFLSLYLKNTNKIDAAAALLLNANSPDKPFFRERKYLTNIVLTAKVVHLFFFFFPLYMTTFTLYCNLPWG